MQRSCIRCLSTSTRSLVSQASSSSSSSSSHNPPAFTLPEHLQNRPVIPELKHVDPQVRELLRRPLQHAAVFYGNDPGALTIRPAQLPPMLKFDPTDKIFDDPLKTPSTSSSSTSSSSFTDFGKIVADVNRSPSSSSSSSQPPISPPALPTITKIIEIPPLEDPLLSFMTNLMMKDGKKTRARKHLSLMLETLRLRSSALPIEQLREAIRLSSPSIRIIQQKKGGSKQVQVPIALGERQKVHKAIKWIIEASDKRKNPNNGGSKKFGERVALEIEAVLNGTSDVLKRKEQLHVTATVARANVNVGSRR